MKSLAATDGNSFICIGRRAFFSTAAALQIGELGFPDYPCMAVHLAIDLVLKHAIGFG